jgi:hypothetical protein
LLAAEGVLVPAALDYLSLDGLQQFARSYYHGCATSERRFNLN